MRAVTASARRGGRIAVLGACAVGWAAQGAWGQVSINANALALRSGGVAAGTGWVLNQNGYVGTYIIMNAPGTVTVSVGATGSAAGSRMNLVVNDVVESFEVSAAAGQYSLTTSLPAGTHFIKSELVNNLAGNGPLTLSAITVSGATVSNSTAAATLNNNALAASDTYIANYRKGSATIALPRASGGLLAPGTEVQVRLRRHDFNFGTAVPGTSNTYFVSNPTPGSTAQKFQQALGANFNMIVPENAGKWASNEPARDVVTMGYVDTLLSYAESHGMRARMHNLIWGQQQPNWVNTLLASAASGNAAAAADLRGEVSERINYYVRDRAHRYLELDVLNEGVHQPQWANAYGVSELASIYNETAAAVAAAGSNAKLFVNEYNVLQDSTDPNANWYRQHAESIRNAGGQVDGIGIQYYAANATGTNNSVHNPSRLFAAMQNLTTGGTPIALTEFGVKAGGTGTTAQLQARAAQILNESMRLMFGNPHATGFTMWGFWANSVWDQAPAAVLYDANWNLTPAGAAWQALMSQWSTDLTATVGEDGTINFTGFYGDYDITIDGVTYPLSLVKGRGGYTLMLPNLLPGDYNGDGRVDAADYTVWADQFGATGHAGGPLAGDGNLDGVVNAADYTIWADHFGSAVPGALGAVAVPEPGGAMLAVAACGLVLRKPRRD